MLRQIIAFAALPLLASCVAPREAAVPMPAPAPAPRPAPAPAPTAVVERYAGDWSVADLDLGGRDWAYRREGSGSLATLGDYPRHIAHLVCGSGRLTIARAGTLSGGIAVSLNIRTSFAERSLPVETAVGSGRAGTAAMLEAASLPASDPLWDQIIYSRGRFVIEAAGNRPMIVPTGAELARVVEDCRG